jgi:hypothetical protein
LTIPLSENIEPLNFVTNSRDCEMQIGFWNHDMPVRRGVSKAVEDARKPPTLRRFTPEMAVEGSGMTGPDEILGSP